jgi:D-alanyl-D-alanine-carboxypeptidase/D-alanyl-D-alanine-endopeptidase
VPESLLSTADDLLSFVRAQLDPSAGPLADAIGLMQQERWRRRTRGAGLGWMRRTTNAGTQLWHNGGTGGFRSFVALAPSDHRAVVILTNSFNLRGPDLEGLRLLVYNAWHDGDGHRHRRRRSDG